MLASSQAPFSQKRGLLETRCGRDEKIPLHTGLPYERGLLLGRQLALLRPGRLLS